MRGQGRRETKDGQGGKVVVSRVVVVVAIMVMMDHGRLVVLRTVKHMHVSQTMS